MSIILVAFGWAVIDAINGTGAGPAPPDAMTPDEDILIIPLGWTVMNAVNGAP